MSDRHRLIAKVFKSVITFIAAKQNQVLLPCTAFETASRRQVEMGRARGPRYRTRTGRYKPLVDKAKPVVLRFCPPEVILEGKWSFAADVTEGSLVLAARIQARRHTKKRPVAPPLCCSGSAILTVPVTTLHDLLLIVHCSACS